VVDSGGRVYTVDPGTQRKILRLTPAGAPDQSFGPDGWRDIALPPDDVITSMSLTHDDGLRLGVGGSFGDQVSDLLVGRLLSDGTPDPAFGTNGWATLKTPASPVWGATPMQLADGKIIVSSGASNKPCAAVVRLRGDAVGDEPLGPADDPMCTVPCLPEQGCPEISRTITISAKRVARNAVLVEGKVESEKAACLGSELDLVRTPGRHNVHVTWAEPTPQHIARYQFKLRNRFLRSARHVSVFAKPRLEPSVGMCAQAESRTIKLPRPKRT
jgi:hypothetical protein